MSRVKLQKLVLETFRGASNPVTLEFDPEKHITMFYGENGTGKSSIVDSFSFLSEQHCGSLRERSEADEDFITSITGTRDNLQVTLVTDKGKWSAKFKPRTKQIVVTPGTGIPPVRILRRKSILALVDTPSSERYKALQSYIEMPGIVKSEASLREAIKGAEREFDEDRRGLTQAQEALDKLWQQQKKPNASAEAWAEAEKARDVAKMEADLKEADGLVGAIEDLTIRKKDWSDAISEHKNLKDAQDKAEASLKDEESKSAGQSGDLVTLLEQAKTFVDANSPVSKCPVCEQDVEHERFHGVLSKRIAAMLNIAGLVKAVVEVKKKADAKEEAIASAKRKYATKIFLAATLVKASKLQCISMVAFPDGLLDLLSNDKTPADDLTINAEEWELSLATLKSNIDNESKNWRETVTLHGAIVRDLETLRRYELQTKARGGLCEFLKSTLKIVESERKAFVTRELDAISEEFDTLFKKIHPGEKLGGVKLSLKEKFQHSLSLAGDFHTQQGIAPQSLFSESHLDTLGLCVFLALAKKYRTEDTIVILDDVVTSVDHSHLSRFIDVLHDEAEHFGHIIITTHYGPWRELYRSGRSPGGQLHFIELAPWTLEKGIRHYKGKLSIDELREEIAKEPFAKQNVAAKAGILLESVLDFVNRSYEGRLPLKHTPGYTLRELTDGLPGKFLRLIRVVRITEKAAGDKVVLVPSEVLVEPIIVRIKGLAALRNQVGCHYTEIGALCSEAEVREFGEVALELAEALVCPVNGDFPTKDKSGAYWESRSGKVQLHPLRQPAN